MAMPVTSVKLKQGLSWSVETVHWQSSVPNAFLRIVDFMTHVDPSLMSLPFQPFCFHFNQGLYFKTSLRSSSCKGSCGHLLHNGQEIERICVVSHDFLADFRMLSPSLHVKFSDFGFARLVVTVKDDGWSFYHIFLEHRVKIFVLFVKKRKEDAKF